MTDASILLLTNIKKIETRMNEQNMLLCLGSSQWIYYEWTVALARFAGDIEVGQRFMQIRVDTDPTYLIITKLLVA